LRKEGKKGVSTSWREGKRDCLYDPWSLGGHVPGPVDVMKKMSCRSGKRKEDSTGALLAKGEEKACKSKKIPPEQGEKNPTQPAAAKKKKKESWRPRKRGERILPSSKKKRS